MNAIYTFAWIHYRHDLSKPRFGQLVHPSVRSFTYLVFVYTTFPTGSDFDPDLVPRHVPCALSLAWPGLASPFSFFFLPDEID